MREATKLLKHFLITHIPRCENRQADELLKLVSFFEDEKLKHIQWETLMEKSIDPYEVLLLDRSSTWIDLICACLADGTLPTYSKEADRVKRRAN